MDPLLAQAVGVTSRNASLCMNRLLPHKRLGLLEELVWDDSEPGIQPEVSSCAGLESALGYGSTLGPVRKRAEQWRMCLDCERALSLRPSDFSSGSERMRAATETASLGSLGAAGVGQIVANRAPDARLRRHSPDLPVVAIITGSSTRGHDAPSQPADIPFFKRGKLRRERRQSVRAPI